MTQHLILTYKNIETRYKDMNYMIENNYTEETKSFITEEEAYNYMNEEIERLNNNYGEECWSKDDFTVYKFDAENWRWREIKVA